MSVVNKLITSPITTPMPCQTFCSWSRLELPSYHAQVEETFHLSWNLCFHKMKHSTEKWTLNQQTLKRGLLSECFEEHAAGLLHDFYTRTRHKEKISGWPNWIRNRKLTQTGLQTGLRCLIDLTVLITSFSSPPINLDTLLSSKPILRLVTVQLIAMYNTTTFTKWKHNLLSC